MNIFNRIFKIGQAEAHSAVNQLEDPIKMTEQGLRDLRLDLDKSLQALAEVKAMAIRARNEASAAQAKALDYENKAVLLLQRAHSGDLPSGEADRLASEALVKKAENEAHAARATSEQEKFEQSASQLDQNVQQLKSTISQWDNELKTLKARVTVSTATKTINQQLAQLDSSGTVALLERMKEKVAVEEALAESYGQIANENKTIDQEIDKALGQSGQSKATQDLQALKAKLGLE
ncbi:phage shock protein A (PspA) family protein [Hymenobacter gelipurpurascens]|uniref:Phage shock protein A (PspA) family protein n=1 Tax=Hymenobacter gelipurpurascens TaxID=89968 RepID=A0A212T497_9BACT|nr:PspA/IM30 family protein [Hymenobacter gelipurpurascens]SNC60651.1 phage shock protein A (PspA) family protein [Hymenobacter gelipurpurascens]